MSSPIIKVNNLSKRYRIGAVQKGPDTLREAVVDLVSSPVKNFRRLRALTKFSNRDENDVIWALKDVSFEVSQGDVLGIIGRNGAGKTTILKILSRITEPTSGTIKIHGRVSSLLEVGTGFHPDLTGRENIFLNGAILGMRKNEIERKFDEIVNFAEIGKFVNTPVKRYSSGMFVRLAFAVAAHLEPEILLVDEVLAVGDMAFQKKCLGRMNDLAKGGRTVLFVSHNMSAIQSLCKTAIWLDNGHIIEKGRSDEVIRHYQESQGGRFGEESSISERSLEEFRGSDFHFRRVEILDIEGGRCNKYKYMDKLVLVVEMGGESAGDFSPEFRIHNELGHLVTTGTAGPHHGKYFSAKVRRIRIVVGPLALTSGEYTISFSVMVMPGNRRLDTWHNAIGFTIVKCQPFEMPWEMPTHLEGVCVIDHTFSEAD